MLCVVHIILCYITNMYLNTYDISYTYVTSYILHDRTSRLVLLIQVVTNTHLRVWQ